MSGPSEKLNKLSREVKFNELNKLKKIWLDLVKQEEVAFQKCCEMDKKHPDKSKEKSDAVRHWWNITNSILWVFTRTRAQHDFELTPFPSTTLARLADISEEISVGNIPKFVTDAKKGGRALWRKERHHIAYAILYHECVSRNEIFDKSPTKTISDRYGVSKRAVQEWVKQRDVICLGIPYRHLSPEQIQQKMQDCAVVYNRIGRGTSPR